MEFTQEFIETNGLTEEQVNAVTGFVQSEIVPTIKKEYEGTANQNAEGILAGASKFAMSKFGLEVEREQGEKYGDYLNRIADKAFTEKQKQLTDKEAELQTKLANFKGGDEFKTQIDTLKKEIDTYKQQVAELEPLKGYDTKYQEASEKLTSMQKEVAYANVKPIFPKDVNQYEADAKWNEFKNSIEEKYDIAIENGKPFAIDKENHHKKVELKALLEKDTNITELLKGRQQRGTGANSVDMQKVDGLPFEIPLNASSEDLSNIVREHLTAELGSITHTDYAKKFAELYSKAKNAKKQ